MSGAPDDRQQESIGARDLADWRSRLGRWFVTRLLQVVDRSRRELSHEAAPYVVLAATALIGLAGALALTAVSAEIYDDVTERDGVSGLDRPVLDTMVSWRSPDLNSWVTHFTDLGGIRVMPLVVVVAAAVLSWWWRRWTPALLLGIAACGSVLMTVVGKQLIGRTRPDTSLAVPPFETSASFPSGHSLNSWVVSLMIVYLVVCRLRSPLWQGVVVAAAGTFAVAMGLSRVYLGHHWLTDVLVAWTLGTAWLFVVITGHRLLVTVGRHQAATRAPP